MNLINKKVYRGISILILLTLYLGLCFEAAALEEMSVGEFHELEGGYSITVAEANVDTGKAIFVLLKEERLVDDKVVNRGEWFWLHDEEFFYFEATLDSVFRREEMIMLHLVDYNWEWVEPPYEEPQEERVEPPYEKPQEERVEPPYEEPQEERIEPPYEKPQEERIEPPYEKPQEERVEPPYEEPQEERVEPPYEKPQEERVEPPYEKPQEERVEPPYAILYSILIVSAAVMVLIFVVFKSIGVKDRIRQQKIEEDRAKMEEWEKEGYDISTLKEVLEGKK